MAEITRGDDLAFQVTLLKNANTFAIDASSTIKVNFVSKRNKLKMLGTDVTLDNNAAGADLPNSLVVVEVDAADSVDLRPGGAYLEIQVDDAVNTNGKTTWRIPIDINDHVIA